MIARRSGSEGRGAAVAQELASARRQAVGFLEALGAEGVPHPRGTLLAHLCRTADLLEGWNAPPDVVLAGLCHAAYGTDGFDRRLLDLSARADLAGAIGPVAEGMVYVYASCDRRYTYSRLIVGELLFRDRFTDTVRTPTRDELRSFMEITFANELDITEDSAAFAAQLWPQLAPVFSRSRELVSRSAWDAYLGACPAELRAVGA